jgi:hypothetical protein
LCAQVFSENAAKTFTKGKRSGIIKVEVKKFQTKGVKI